MNCGYGFSQKRMSASQTNVKKGFNMGYERQVVRWNQCQELLHIPTGWNCSERINQKCWLCATGLSTPHILCDLGPCQGPIKAVRLIRSTQPLATQRKQGRAISPCGTMLEMFAYRKYKQRKKEKESREGKTKEALSKQDEDFLRQ